LKKQHRQTEEQITALYARLSRDDEREGTSGSIENQRVILEQYAREHNLPNPRFFADDGYSGVTFTRPAFMEIMELAEQGEIGIIVTKDEAGFGRINKPKYCWCRKGFRPSVPCHHIREYRYVYGAVEPLTGESCFLVMPYCNTVCMNRFLEELEKQYPDDIILLCCDGAAWHKAGSLCIPKNIRLFYIPPYTPEMNPIEQIWKELRKIGFHTEAFASLQKVVFRLCDSICSLSPHTIQHITSRSWILSCFN